MIHEMINNLEKGKQVIQNISQEQYTDTTVAPYFSSIGSHIRHILDMFNCVFTGYPNGMIDLAKRDRNLEIETNAILGIDYFNLMIEKLSAIKPSALETDVQLADDFGNGKVIVQTTLGAVLAQTHSHAIHHYATIGSIMYHLGVCLPDDDFGVNPTTPKKVQQT